MEGVAFSARLAFEALEASAGLRRRALQPAAAARAPTAGARSAPTPSAARSAAWPPADAAALGAAICAGVGCGAMASLADGGRPLVHVRPDLRAGRPRRASTTTRKFGKYRELYARLKSFNEAYA